MCLHKKVNNALGIHTHTLYIIKCINLKKMDETIFNLKHTFVGNFVHFILFTFKNSCQNDQDFGALLESCFTGWLAYSCFKSTVIGFIVWSM